jgi:hypothetical protein
LGRDRCCVVMRVVVVVRGVAGGLAAVDGGRLGRMCFLLNARLGT